MVEVDVKLSPNDLYDYNLRHTYTSMAGILATLVGAVGALYGFYKSYWLLMIVGVILVFYTPIMLLLKSRQAFALSPSLKNTLHYMMDENGLTISQGESSVTYTWDEIVKAVSTSRSIIVYTGKYNATIIPKKQVQDSLSIIIETISKNLDPKKNKIRS